jgi:hypothetical protein
MRKLDSLLLSAALGLIIAQNCAMQAASAGSKATAAASSKSAASASTTTAAATTLTVSEAAGTSKSVKQGEQATVAVKTNPNAKGTITVKLKSGASKNAALQPQQAGADGVITWTWTMAKNTAPGPADWTVVVKQRNRSAQTQGTIQVEKGGAAK